MPKVLVRTIDTIVAQDTSYFLSRFCECEVTVAQSPAEAIDLLSKTLYDVLVLDLNSAPFNRTNPIVDLAQRAKDQKVPIVIFGPLMAHEIKGWFGLGETDYQELVVWPAPYDEKGLYGAIQRVLSRG